MVTSPPAATVVTAILRCDFCAAKLPHMWSIQLRVDLTVCWANARKVAAQKLLKGAYGILGVSPVVWAWGRREQASDAEKEWSDPALSLDSLVA